MSSSETIFSKIIAGDVPALILYEDDETMAFLDHNPVTKGHCLVVPKKAVDHIDECDEDLYKHIFATAHKVSKLLKVRLHPERIALIVHGYEVPHAHVHVVPVYHHGDVGFPKRPDKVVPRRELEKILDALLGKADK